mmetsp:Transcript_55408/g.98679  ORF Transcript_55408/g.98679 Transcript_55408/m.98679 type:complete len:84 (-) Transcript_55408:3136-3387(-)
MRSKCGCACQHLNNLRLAHIHSASCPCYCMLLLWDAVYATFCQVARLSCTALEWRPPTYWRTILNCFTVATHTEMASLVWPCK